MIIDKKFKVTFCFWYSWCRDSVVLRLFFLNRGIRLFTVLQNMPIVFKTNYWPTESFKIFSYEVSKGRNLNLLKKPIQNVSDEISFSKFTEKNELKNVSYEISKSEMFPPPLSVRPRLRDWPLQLLVPHDGLALRVHQQHPARTKSALLDDVTGFDVVNANLGGHHHHVVLRDVVSEMEEIELRTTGFFLNNILFIFSVDWQVRLDKLRWSAVRFGVVRWGEVRWGKARLG